MVTPDTCGAGKITAYRNPEIQKNPKKFDLLQATDWLIDQLYNHPEGLKIAVDMALLATEQKRMTDERLWSHFAQRIRKLEKSKAR